LTINVLQLPGTLHGLDDMDGNAVSNPNDGWLATSLAGNTAFNYIYVDYPALVMPMGPSIATGVANTRAAIIANPGPFVLVGTSQGADVVSRVHDEIMSGTLPAAAGTEYDVGGTTEIVQSLVGRQSDYLAGIVFGNPRRQASHTFSGCPAVPGYGIDHDLMSDVPDTFWDFVIPGDICAAQYASPFTHQNSYWMAQAWEIGQTDTEATPLAILAAMHGDLPVNIFELIEAVLTIMRGVDKNDPHGLWWGWNPMLRGLVSEVGGSSCYQLAVDYIESLA
jgi:hypothetical protein